MAREVADLLTGRLHASRQSPAIAPVHRASENCDRFTIAFVHHHDDQSADAAVRSQHILWVVSDVTASVPVSASG